MQTGEDLCSLSGVIKDEAIDEAAMDSDDLFREILAAPPCVLRGADTRRRSRGAETGSALSRRKHGCQFGQGDAD